MILVFIILLFLILTVFWYLLVRNIIYEDFPYELSSASKNSDVSDSTYTVDENDNGVSTDIESDNESCSDNKRGGNRNNSYVCLISNNKYLNVSPDYELVLGKKCSNSIFKILDHSGESIQLESLKYPGYLLYFGDAPCFRTGNYARESKRSLFVPLGFGDQRDKIVLVTENKDCYLDNRKGKLMFSPFSKTRERRIFKGLVREPYLYIEKAKI